MPQDVVPIIEVKPDIDPIKTATVSSPLKEPFEGMFNGRTILIPPMKKEGNRWVSVPSQAIPLPVAHLIAEHIAKKIIQEEYREKIKFTKSEKEKQKLEEGAIPQFREKVSALMIEMVTVTKAWTPEEAEPLEEV